ncbi:DUF6668 family protein [Streptomyces sp. ICN441]|uniref:DUF6668 family protein n=1 Tax=Streptomyces sp. ICN441 TaxID=2558286 RepID=UPI00320A4EA5
MVTNPWVTRERDAGTAQSVPPETAETAREPARPVGPQPGGVTAPPQGLPLQSARGARWWWLGCHGGAGVTSLSAVVPGGSDAARCWPVPPMGPLQRVVLVARSHASGLLAAQLAGRQWASGSVPGVEVLGLVVVADAPGKLPAPLRDLQKLVSGGFPRTWTVPWAESWRLGRPPVDAVPRELARLARDLQTLTESGVPQ